MEEVVNHAESVGLITSILLLLVLARVLGELMNRIKQAPVVGEILAGVILGPAVFDLIHPTAELKGIAELSVFLILLSAGLEMDFREVARAFLGRGAILGAITFLVPAAAGIALGVAFQSSATQSVILGLVFAITALPVIIRILSNFKVLDTTLGQNTIATAVFNDIAALFFLGVILGMPSTQFSFAQLLESIRLTGGKLMIFALIILGVTWLFSWAGNQKGYIENSLRKVMSLFGKEALFGLTILFVLIVGSLSEELSSHFVIGVFFGGLLISHEAIGKELFHDLEETLNSITGGFLAPIFFAFIGLNFSLEPLKSVTGFLFAVLVIAISIGSKVFAGEFGGRLAKIAPVEAMGIGIMINSRGTMDLVVADIAFTRGVIGKDLFSTLVLLSIVSTVLSPILFRKFVLEKVKTSDEDDATQVAKVEEIEEETEQASEENTEEAEAVAEVETIEDDSSEEEDPKK